jgi:putative membrane protein
MKLSKRGLYFKAISKSTEASIFAPLVLPFYLGYEYLYWKNFSYSFEEDDLKIKSGVFSKNELDIPLRRIQDVETSQDFLQRVIGITKVDVKTAGGDTSKASLKYLDEGQVESVRQEIWGLKNRRKETQTEKDSSNELETFYDIENFLGTYCAVNGAQFAVMLALISFTFGIIVSAYSASSTLQMGVFTILTIILTILTSAAVFLLAAFGTYSAFYDFEVHKRGDTFEYERGLFNKQGGSIPEEKIQKLEIAENFMMRYLGLASLKAETAGYESSENDTTTKTLIPLDKKETVYQHANNLGEMNISQMKGLDKTAKKRYFHRYVAISAISSLICLPLIYTWFNPGILILPLILLIFSKKAAGLKWANIGYSLGEKNLIVMKGFWNRRMYIAPYFRFQNIIASETLFQKRWNQASLTLDTAGDKVVNPQIPDLDSEKAYKLKNELYQRFRNSVY